MNDIEKAVGEAFEQACRDDVEVLKPGNVHVFAAGHGMSVADFVASARAARPFVAWRGARVGQRLLGGVRATIEAAGCNTNLGILLLCAPLAAAAETGSANLQSGIETALSALDATDAENAFAAIRLASPGGLGGSARHDVRRPPRGSLSDAMREAAPRDLIARQYATGFADLFQTGIPTLRRARQRREDRDSAVLAVYLAFLSAFPDSHIARKYGIGAAAMVQADAERFQRRVMADANLPNLHADLMNWDAALKSQGLNPGTSADLTVATLFAASLESILRPIAISD